MPDTDRRSALALVAAIAAGGATLTSCAKDSDQGEVTANEDLMREHGVLRRILVVYREIAPRLAASPQAVDARAISEAAGLFRKFGEHYHEQLLEEQHIFPIARKANAQAGMLVDTLLLQHARGREITDFILDRTRTGIVSSGDADPIARAMTSFSRMYEAHTSREDTLIFPTFKKALGAKRYDEIGDQFEDIERKEFGGDGFDMALAQVGRIEQALGVSDLAAFTAPAPLT